MVRSENWPGASTTRWILHGDLEECLQDTSNVTKSYSKHPGPSSFFERPYCNYTFCAASRKQPNERSRFSKDLIHHLCIV